MPRRRQYWLMKSEPDEFSIDDLRRSKNGTARWDGVRNYQARNFLRDDFEAGDAVLFYHSSCDSPGIAGEAVVVRKGYPDPSAFDPDSSYYDPKSDPTRPVWYSVDVKFVRACRNIITRPALAAMPELKTMLVLKRGIRLSVQPVTESEWRVILNHAEWV